VAEEVRDASERCGFALKLHKTPKLTGYSLFCPRSSKFAGGKSEQGAKRKEGAVIKPRPGRLTKVHDCHEGSVLELRCVRKVAGKISGSDGDEISLSWLTYCDLSGKPLARAARVGRFEVEELASQISTVSLLPPQFCSY
jgi:hypothetical protein